MVVFRYLQPARLGWAGLAAVWLLGAAPAGAQMVMPVAQPYVADIQERSGLISRFTPVPEMLPHDHYRDSFYRTRWADRPQFLLPNWLCHNGLYGLSWQAKCTECYQPYFFGSPGQSTLNPNCRRVPPLFRGITNITHPFKPVGMYYSGGCYVPLYDLDPLVTGPGPNPWLWFYNWCKGG
jgi:hypothetical protein